MSQPISHHHQRKLTVLASSFRKGGWEAVALIIHANALDASQVRAQLFEYFLSADEVKLA